MPLLSLSLLVAALGSRICPWEKAVGRAQPSHGVTDWDVQPSTLFITLSNKWLAFLDRGKKHIEGRGEALRGCVGSSPRARCQPAGTGTGAAPGRGPRRGVGDRSRVSAAGGTMFCLCSYFWAGRTNREVVFLQSHCSSQTEHIIQPVLLTASEVTARGPSAAHPSTCGDAGKR